MRVTFGPYLPDIAPIANQRGLLVARNMRPKAVGYHGLKGLANLTNADALTLRPRGSLSGTSADGTGFLFAGDANDIYEFQDSGMVKVSQVTGGYALGTQHRWDFAKFSDNIIGVSPNEPSQSFAIGASTAFADINNAPRARHIAVIENVLMMGNIYDPVLGPLPNAVSWSGILQPLNWPTLPSDAATSVSAGQQILEGDGGWVQDVVSGAEVGLVFQERAIHRLDFVGGQTIFNFNRIAANTGMLVPHSAVPFERLVFYIAEDGFRISDYTTSKNIGKDKVNRTFLADLDATSLDRVSTAKDPDETLIWIAYPGPGNVGGRPNRLMFWDYVLDQFSHADVDLESLIPNATDFVPSLDAPDNPPTDPDELGDPPDDFNIGQTSFDDRSTAEGNSRMGAFDTSFIASDFSGDDLEGLIETGDMELHPGQRGFATAARPLVDSREAEVAIAAKSKTTGTMTFGRFVPQDEDGKVPLRSDGRYHRFQIKLPPGWDDAVGVDITSTPSGSR